MQADRGYGYERTKHNPLEKALADAWEKENLPRPGINFGNGILQDLFFNPAGRPVHEITDAERMVAATVVQWLGSNVGFSFLSEVFKSQNYLLLPKEMFPANLSGFASSTLDALAEFHRKTRKLDLIADLGLNNLMPVEELVLDLAHCLGIQKQHTLAKVRELLEDSPEDRGDLYDSILALAEKEKEDRANPALAVKERLLAELRRPRDHLTVSEMDSPFLRENEAIAYDDPDEPPF